ncbi:right-handed parallel beta-helix repeat-containing protein, partial [Burkholderia sp. SIMBA_051]
AGRYHPARRDAGRIAAFTLYDGVEVYGGFAGTETDVAQRRRDAAPTVLSAKLAAGDDRYQHVVYGANQAVLDGLTIRDGNAVG